MEATIIYPHQLFSDHPALDEDRPVYLVEESLILTHNPTHRGKLLLHKLSMDAYESELADRGYNVTRISIIETLTTEDVFKRLKQAGIETVHIADTVDDYLEQTIAESGLERIWYETPSFMLEQADAKERFTNSKRHLTRFYKQIRLDHDIMIDGDGEPLGGQWSFDEDNRKKIPKHVAIPDDPELIENDVVIAAREWVQTLEANDDVKTELYGEATIWLPYTCAGARSYLQEFLTERFADFGPYEDALTTRGVRLWHSTLSPLINLGLLTPTEVIDTALAHAKEHNTPVNSLEGFVRQIIGWREFMRASYIVDGRSMRSQNFFRHTRPLPKSFWTGDTGVMPVDHAIAAALQYGYNHHIDRLMVMGNFMLLSQINPQDVYRWFMGMYLDAYDWVMVPNVYSMSQFADGGSFATKPYISGANYIKKMSDYPSDKDAEHNWEKTWTALYWNFINIHYEIFKANHRMSMMPNLLDRMKDETREEHLHLARTYLAN